MNRDAATDRPLTVAIAGLGAIGMQLARLLDAGSVAGMRLAAVSAGDLEAARGRCGDLQAGPAVVPVERLAEHGDIVVECAPARIFASVAEPAIAAGRCLMPLSVGALLGQMHLVETARRTGARIVVPTGALIGLDTVRAMAVGTIDRVTLETRKHPRGLAGAPYLIANEVDLDDLTEAECVFEGTAREAAAGFPANVNVAAALALAGIGPDRTRVRIWADPGVDRNIQSVAIRSDCGEAEMTIRNIPSEANPRTGRIVANSVIAALRRFTEPLIAGS